jgi:hypothetical protein
MSMSSISSVINTAMQSAQLQNDISIAVAGKAMDAQKQEGANALALIASATGKGHSFDAQA